MAKNVKLKLTEEQIQIVKILDEAPALFKTGYYVAGKMGKGFDNIYRKMKVLEAMGVLITHKSISGKVSFLVDPPVMNSINKRKK